MNSFVNKDFTDENSKKLLGAVGLAARARKCLTGTDICIDYMRAGKGKLLVIASDISENTMKKLVKTAVFHKIPYTEPGIDKGSLAKAVGKKSDAAAVLLTAGGFVKIIENLGVEIHITDTEVLL